jgi:ABC-2 type transport system ATP-binding protein
MTVATLTGVSKRYGEICALEDFSLELEPDSTVALLGPNGAGKSTLASILLGLRRPDRGSARVCGLDPRDRRARTRLGAMPQELAFPQTMPLVEIVELVAHHFPDARAPGDVLAEFGLQEHARRQTGALSVGQRRRLGVALAFVARPALVVLDEPTAGVDLDGRRAVWRAVQAARRQGAAVLVATHDLDEAEAVASRVVAIDRGRIVADGTPDAIRSRAGLTRVTFGGDANPLGFERASCADGRVTLDVADAGAAVAALVHAGIPLPDLTVRPLTLQEALTTLEAGPR